MVLWLFKLVTMLLPNTCTPYTHRMLKDLSHITNCVNYNTSLYQKRVLNLDGVHPCMLLSLQQPFSQIQSLFYIGAMPCNVSGTACVFLHIFHKKNKKGSHCIMVELWYHYHLSKSYQVRYIYSGMKYMDKCQLPYITNCKESPVDWFII